MRLETIPVKLRSQLKLQKHIEKLKFLKDIGIDMKLTPNTIIFI